MSSSISVWMYLKRQKKADAEGKIPIYVRVIIDGDREDFSLSRKVLPGEWSQTKQKCTGKSQEALLINAKITKTKGDLTRIFDRFPTGEVVRAKQVVNTYQGEGRGKEDNSKKGLQFHKDVLAAIDRYLELKKREKKVLKDERPDSVLLPIIQEKEQMIQTIEVFLKGWHSWLDDTDTEKTILDAQYFFLLKFMYRVIKGNASHETFRKWVSTKNTYVSFLTYRYKIPDLPLKSLSPKFAVDLHEYLTLTNSVGNNATMKYIKNLKQIIDEAVDRKWLGQNPLESFKCKYVDPERQALTLNEIARVIDHPFTNSRLAEVRDVFVFCCFTGFAYQEVYSLRPKDLTVGIDGKNWINTNRNKTKNPEFLPLLPVPEDLIAKYKAHTYCIKYRKLLPVNSNQRFNEYLKEIGAVCGLDIEITTHTARHTFATTIAIEHDIPLKIVSVMLGHRSQRTTEIYARASKQAISRNMTKLQKKLFGKGRDLKVGESVHPVDIELPGNNGTKKIQMAGK